ncbi:MAG: N-acetylglucosamine-6-phosphate deacetylase [Chloroflexota bacterium]|nr:N-acetylglucosamine-6-phosphate deacetylase [Chloroflexota bacterium]
MLAGGVVGLPPAADNLSSENDDSVAPAGLVLDGERIVRVLATSEVPTAPGRVLDFRPHLLAPGTIDVHTHGAVGCSFSSGPPEDTLAVCRYRATTGATALLPTITGQWEELIIALAKLGALAGATGQHLTGAAILGIHVEGPFLNPERKGAIDVATMRPPGVDDLRRLQDAAGGWIKMMTIAPELPGALTVIEEMARLGIVPSIGHSDASYETVLAAASAGARKSTHTYNAMRPLQHRDPGTVGGILADDRLVAELIADGVHVHLGAIRVLLNAKGPAGTVLVTDGVRYAGLPEGDYERPGRGRLTVAEGAAKTDDGTIAGSVSPIDRNLRLLRDSAGVTTNDLFTMAAAVPARLLGLSTKGTLVPGADADFAVYDAELRCKATFVGGQRVF